MTKWLLATHLMCASKKSLSTHQLHRMLGLSYETAWFMAHRIREGMRELNTTHMGGGDKTVEMDESFVDSKEKNKLASKRQHLSTGGVGKEAVFSLAEWGRRVRSHHVPNVTAKTLLPILEAQIDGASFVMKDEGSAVKKVGGEFEKHAFVNHGVGEYVRGDVHTNTIEGYFSTMKRGIIGTCHHVSQQHLKRYLAEFDFKYNERSALGTSDAERIVKAVNGVVGKRLAYQPPSSLRAGFWA